ncbi:cytochrome c, partial [Aurantibacter sp.]|uniref:c-type cytochrome n=1 Tax=Aurantibacter sp. TaxID=2807103 RepID=UPI003265EADC
VSYNGKKEEFNEDQLIIMEERKEASNVRTPDIVNDNLMKNDAVGGEKLYYQYCSACHQTNGKGASGRFPPLVNTDWVLGDSNRLIKVLLRGMEGSLEINGEVFNGVMPQHSFLKDKEVAQILTYIRSNFGNSASKITAKQVAETRKNVEEDKENNGPIKVATK